MSNRLLFTDVLAEQPHNKGLSAPPIFSQGEKVFAFHQNMIYEAKVLKTELRNKLNSSRLGEQELFYYIHYQGWKSTWDEWVNDTRIVKFTDQNREFQKIMREQRYGKKKKQKSLSNLMNPLSEQPTFDSITDITDVPESIELPFILQKQLAEDYDMIINQKYVVAIPVSNTVSDILASLADEKLAKSNKTFNLTVISEIQDYFDQCLGTLLLYRFERPQYQKVLDSIKEGKIPKQFSQIYGAQHLLRLLYKLPSIIEGTPMNGKVKKLIFVHIIDILEYLEKNVSDLFNSSKDYKHVSTAYLTALDY